MNALLLAFLLAAPARAALRDLPPGLPHPATIPTVEREVGIPLQIPVPQPPPELDRRPEAEERPKEEEVRRGPIVIDMVGGAEEEAAPAAPTQAEVRRAVASGDPRALLDLFDGSRRAAVDAVAKLAADVPLEPARVQPLLRVCEPLAVERIRDAAGSFPPPGAPQQLFNTAVHDALSARPMPQGVAEDVAAGLRRLAARAINDPKSLEDKLLARFRARQAKAGADRR